MHWVWQPFAPSGAKPPLLVDGVITPAGTLQLTPLKATDGTLTPTSLLTLFQQRMISPSSTLTPTGALAKQIERVLTPGVIDLSGTLAQQLERLFTGSIDSTGALATVKAQSVLMDGSLALSGELRRSIAKALAGVLALEGEMLKQIAPETWDGTLGLAGALARVPVRLDTGTITPTATLDLQAATTIELDGVLPLSGTVAGVPVAAMAGALPLSGALSKQVSKNIFSGFLMSLGELALSSFRTQTLEGTVTPVGTLAQDQTLAFEGQLSPTSALRLKPIKFLTGLITAVGTASASVLQQVTAAGSIGLSGVLTTHRVLAQLFTGVLSFTSTLAFTVTSVSTLGLVTMVNTSIRAAGLMKSAMRAVGLLKPRVR